MEVLIVYRQSIGEVGKYRDQRQKDGKEAPVTDAGEDRVTLGASDHCPLPAIQPPSALISSTLREHRSGLGKCEREDWGSLDGASRCEPVGDTPALTAGAPCSALLLWTRSGRPAERWTSAYPLRG